MIFPLSTAAGITFANSGLVILRESFEYVDKLLKGEGFSPKNSRHYFTALTIQHERIHFLQALSCDYLYKYSLALATLIQNYWESFRAKPSGDQKKYELLHLTFASLNVRKNWFSILDLIEGMATIESYKLVSGTKSPENFYKYRHDILPGDSTSCYWRAYDYLAESTSPDFALHLLSPLTFLALQTDNPPEWFKNTIDLNIKGMSKSELLNLVETPVVEMFTFFSLQLDHHLFFNYPKDNLMMNLAFRESANRFELNDLLEITSRPSIIRYLYQENIYEESDFDVLQPPVVVMPSVKENHVTIRVNGIAEIDKEYINGAILTAGLQGASERWLYGESAGEPYRFCPHNDCPTYNCYLCQTYFFPPSITSNYRDCGFNDLMHRRTGRYPNELWKIKYK